MNNHAKALIDAFNKGYKAGKADGEKLSEVSYQMLACGFIAALKPLGFDADQLAEVIDTASNWIVAHEKMSPDEIQAAMEDEMGVELNIWSN